MAFGEEIANNVGGRTSANKYGQTDSVRQRFTGYQKDDETGLDFAEARYYNDAHGRFTAVDPLLASGKSVNPQTFNRYVYTMNRPLNHTDPTGMQVGKQYEGGSPYFPTIKAIRFAIGNLDTALRIGTGSERSSLSSAAIRFSSRSGVSDALGGVNGETVRGDGTQVNAVRHVVWQASIRNQFGDDVAIKVGNVHERNPQVDLGVRTFTGTANNLANADQTIDLLNNQIGRQIGANNPVGTSIIDLAKQTLEYFHNTGLFTATINSDGSVAVVQTRLSDAEYNTAVENISNLTAIGETLNEQTQRNQQVENDNKQREKNQRTLPGKYQD
jgi:RHS repeat-associated protein